jgi:subtilisin family serine protease
LSIFSLNANAADTTNADQLWSGGGLGLNLTGAGVTVGIWDDGAVRATHRELAGRVTVVDGGLITNHSTHVAGTIAATGLDPGTLVMLLTGGLGLLLLVWRRRREKAAGLPK